MADIPEDLSAALAPRYRLEREAGRGGMATVYLARDERHDRRVAVKVLPPHVAARQGTERFLREIRIAAALSHPNILPLYDSGEAAGCPFYVMPYVEGESLKQLLARTGRLPVADVIQISREVADALDYAHRRGIVHLDIKPANILLQEGHAVVADFGIARALSAADELPTETAHPFGTAAYMSPEQALRAGVLDGRSDLFSLGCVMFEMLAGVPPFGPRAEAWLERLTTSAPSILTSRPDAGEAIARAVSLCLERDIARRAATARVVIDAIAGDLRATLARAIAVLPFVNVGGDQENDYFSDGLTEEVITDLSRVKALTVTSRSSSMRLKGTTKDLRTIGRQLGVGYVLEGSVRKAGQSVRITAQLVNTETDAQLWADKYTGTIDDVFDLQERVSREITRALDVSLTSDEDQWLSARPIRDARIFETCLRARFEIRRIAPGSIDRALKIIAVGLELDPDSTALLALRSYAELARLKSGAPVTPETIARVDSEARDIFARAPGSPQGYAALGYLAFERGRIQEAVRLLKSAVELEPDVDALLCLALSYLYAGRLAAGERVARRLLAIDPLTPVGWELLSVIDWFSGRFDHGVEVIERAVERDPENAMARWMRGYVLALAGRIDEATAEALWLIRLDDHFRYGRQLMAMTEALRGHRDEAARWLTSLDTIELDYHLVFHLGESYAVAGDTARGLELVERAVQHGFHPPDFIARHDPFLEPLRSAPAFDRIVAEARRQSEAFEE